MHIIQPLQKFSIYLSLAVEVVAVVQEMVMVPVAAELVDTLLVRQKLAQGHIQ